MKEIRQFSRSPISIEEEERRNFLEEFETLTMEEGGDVESDVEREVDEDEQEEANNPLRDRFRLSTISIAESQAKRNNMEISQPIMVCVADMAFKYAEQLAKDLELFSQHAGRKSVNMEDVILAAHRNEHLTAQLRSFCNNMKGKEPQTEKKRKKGPRKGNKATPSVLHIDT